MQVNGAELHASAEESDMYAAIDQLVDKLSRQLTKHKENWDNTNTFMVKSQVDFRPSPDLQCLVAVIRDCKISVESQTVGFQRMKQCEQQYAFSVC